MHKKWKNLLYICLASFSISLAMEVGANIGVAKQIGSSWELPALTQNKHWNLKSGTYDIFAKAKIMFPIAPIVTASLGVNFMKYNSRKYTISFKSLDYAGNSIINEIKNVFKYTDNTNSPIDETEYKVSSVSFELEPTISIYFLDLYCGLCIDSHKQSIAYKLEDIELSTRLINEKLVTGKVGFGLAKGFQINETFAIYLGLGYELRNLFSFSDTKKLGLDSLPKKHFIKANLGAAFSF